MFITHQNCAIKGKFECYSCIKMSGMKEAIDLAFEHAIAETSSITEEIEQMEGMTGTQTRHFYNNMLKMNDARYLEIGTWTGSSVCSAMCGNKATVVCIDNWSEFGGPKEKFSEYFTKYKGENTARFIEADCFKVDIRTLPKFNIFLYDGAHDEESHYKVLIHYYDCLDDTFIFIVDDWNHQVIREATYRAIKDLNLRIVYSREVHTKLEGMTMIEQSAAKWQWWDGIYVAILQKGSK
jgi:hypothetical protein